MLRVDAASHTISPAPLCPARKAIPLIASPNETPEKLFAMNGSGDWCGAEGAGRGGAVDLLAGSNNTQRFATSASHARCAELVSKKLFFFLFIKKGEF